MALKGKNIEGPEVYAWGLYLLSHLQQWMGLPPNISVILVLGGGLACFFFFVTAVVDDNDYDDDTDEDDDKAKGGRKFQGQFVMWRT